MGVKYLWSILSPVCDRKSLWEIQGKSLAIDLSGWVCDSQNISEGNKPRPQMYLRNLFFRTNCLLILGVHPVFVLEGKAPEMKYDVIEKRRLLLNKQTVVEGQPSKKRVRSHLNSLLKKCEQLLQIMGLSCARSPGEAESLCAFLNQKEVVDGCISQDGDCFLYGATTVYRNFCVSSSGGSNAGFSVDVYQMARVEERLSLGRCELAAVALLCGCDYDEAGVKGVGKERVLAFLEGVRGDAVLDRMKRWRTDSYFDDLEEKRLHISKGKICEKCGHKGNKRMHLRAGCVDCRETQGCIQGLDYSLSSACAEEVFIRKKALLDPEFPSEKIIDEFFNSNVKYENIAVDKSWKKPDVHGFINFASTSLAWSDEYAIAKFLPLMTRWQLTVGCKDVEASFFFEPECIVKKRTVKGVKSYEIRWIDIHNIVKSITPDISVVTVEPEQLFDAAYPSVVEAYLVKKGEKVKQGKKKQNSGKSSKNLRKRVLTVHNQMTIESYFPESNNDITKNTKIIQREGFGAELDSCKENNSHAIETKKSDGTLNPVSKCLTVFSQYEEERLFSVSTPKRDVVKHMSPVCSPLCKYRRETSEWENCHVCCEDDDMNMSAIVNTILTKKTSSEKKLLAASLPSSTVDEQESKSAADESIDEFDLIITEKYVPLMERIRLKQ